MLGLCYVNLFVVFSLFYVFIICSVLASFVNVQAQVQAPAQAQVQIDGQGQLRSQERTNVQAQVWHLTPKAEQPRSSSSSISCTDAWRSRARRYLVRGPRVHDVTLPCCWPTEAADGKEPLAPNIHLRIAAFFLGFVRWLLWVSVLGYTWHSVVPTHGNGQNVLLEDGTWRRTPMAMEGDFFF